VRVSPVAVRVLGYPIETVLAEMIATAIELGPASTRVRDYADLYTLTGSHALSYVPATTAPIARASVSTAITCRMAYPRSLLPSPRSRIRWWRT